MLELKASLLIYLKSSIIYLYTDIYEKRYEMYEDIIKESEHSHKGKDEIVNEKLNQGDENSRENIVKEN